VVVTAAAAIDIDIAAAAVVVVVCVTIYGYTRISVVSMATFEHLSGLEASNQERPRGL
jgi:hypothetical protein